MCWKTIIQLKKQSGQSKIPDLLIHHIYFFLDAYRVSCYCTFTTWIGFISILEAPLSRSLIDFVDLKPFFIKCQNNFNNPQYLLLSHKQLGNNSFHSGHCFYFTYKKPFVNLIKRFIPDGKIYQKVQILFTYNESEEIEYNKSIKFELKIIKI